MQCRLAILWFINKGTTFSLEIKQINVYQFLHLRLPSKSLKNVKTGLCIHPNGGWAGENVQLVHWGSCDSSRIALDFLKLKVCISMTGS